MRSQSLACGAGAYARVSFRTKQCPTPGCECYRIGGVRAPLSSEVKKLRLKWIATTVACGFLACQASVVLAQDQPPASDNTKTNQRDRSKTQPTADQAKNKTADLENMQKIRKSITSDKSLSTYAHNVKIISQDGKVTLKGPVRTDEEKSTVVKLATDVAGPGNVTDEVTVVPKK
jgi:osmotically-inducible protein OsmY